MYDKEKLAVVAPAMYETLKDIYDSLSAWWDIDKSQRESIVEIITTVEGESALDR